MGKPTLLSEAAANPVVQSLTAGLAAAGVTGSTAVGISLALFQTLFSSAAGTEIANNLRQCLEETVLELEDLRSEVAVMNANQILVAHQAVREMFVSIDRSRLEILKRIAIGAVKDRNLDEDDSYVIARVLRDVTPGEVEFLAKYFQYPQIYLKKASFGSNPEPEIMSSIAKEGGLRLEGSMKEVKTIEGLLRTGLMKRSDSWAEAYEFTLVVAKLLAILKK